MSQTSIRGILKGQTTVVLDSAAPLPDGTVVEVTPIGHEVGTTAAVLAAMNAEPHVSRDDIAELVAAIAAGRRPKATLNLFEEKNDPTRPM